MSIRFHLSRNPDIHQQQIFWITHNVPRKECYVSNVGLTVDFFNDEDASIFTMMFGVKKSSTKLERMIALEELYERMEEYNTRNSKNGLGPLS